MLISSKTLLCGIVISAVICSPVSAKPAEINTLFESEKPYGQADFTWLWFDVYNIALWTDANKWNKNTGFALSITYKLNFSSTDLVDKTIEEIDRINGDKPAPESFRPQLLSYFPNVKKGDRITAYFSPQGSVSFYHNGRQTGKIDDYNFSRYFADIWLSDKTISPETRQKLLNIP